MAQSRINNRTKRIVLYGCLVLAIIVVGVVASIVVYFIIQEKNAEQRIQSIYTSITPYPNSSIVLEKTDFGTSNALICGIIFSEGWRGTNAPFSEVTKYYLDEFAGLKWQNEAGYTTPDDIKTSVGDSNEGGYSTPFAVVEISNYRFINQGLPAIAQARQDYQTVYLVTVRRWRTNDCP